MASSLLDAAGCDHVRVVIPVIVVVIVSLVVVVERHARNAHGLVQLVPKSEIRLHSEMNLLQHITASRFNACASSRQEETSRRLG